MQIYNKYVVTRRYKKLAQCGNVNISYGTECIVVNNHITCDKGIICFVGSQDAFGYFSQNDDGNGLERGRLTQTIIKRLEKKENDSTYQDRWDKIWDDPLCQKYKNTNFPDHWLWNYEFYNAPLYDLQYIAKLVGAK